MAWPESETIPDWFRTIPNKVPLLFRGGLLYPELIVLRLLEDAKWNGVFVRNWGGREFWTDVGAVCRLPLLAQEFFDTTEARVKRYRRGTGGCWDVFAWKDTEFALIELKQRSNDRSEPFKQSQLHWLEAALAASNAVSLFVVEYEKVRNS